MRWQSKRNNKNPPIEVLNSIPLVEEWISSVGSLSSESRYTPSQVFIPKAKTRNSIKAHKLIKHWIRYTENDRLAVHQSQKADRDTFENTLLSLPRIKFTSLSACTVKPWKVQLQHHLEVNAYSSPHAREVIIHLNLWFGNLGNCLQITNFKTLHCGSSKILTHLKQRHSFPISQMGFENINKVRARTTLSSWSRYGLRNWAEMEKSELSSFWAVLFKLKSVDEALNSSGELKCFSSAWKLFHSVKP